MSIFQFENQQSSEIDKEPSIFDLQSNNYQVRYNSSQNLEQPANNRINRFKKPERIIQNGIFSAKAPSLSEQFLQQLIQTFENTLTIQDKDMILGKNSYLKTYSKKTPYNYGFIAQLYRIWQIDPLFYKNKRYEKDYHLQPKLRPIYGPPPVKENIIYAVIRHNPLLTLQQISELIENDQDWQMDDLLGHLHQLYYKTYKIVRLGVYLINTKRNSQSDKFRRMSYCSSMINLLNRGIKVIYLDEFIINKWTGRTQAYVKKNIRGAYISNVMANLRSQSFIIVATMNETGKIRYEVLLGNSSTQKYQKVIIKLIKYQMEFYKNNQKILVIHKAIQRQAKMIIQEACKACGIKVKYLPAFSPQLNPLELWFSEINRFLKKNGYLNDRQLIHCTKYILENQFQARKCKKYFFKVQKYFKKGMNYADF